MNKVHVHCSQRAGHSLANSSRGEEKKLSQHTKKGEKTKRTAILSQIKRSLNPIPFFFLTAINSRCIRKSIRIKYETIVALNILQFSDKTLVLLESEVVSVYEIITRFLLGEPVQPWTPSEPQASIVLKELL